MIKVISAGSAFQSGKAAEAIEKIEDKELAQIAQGEYYFSDTFDGVLFEPDEQDHMLDINVEKDQPEQSFYEKIREHNALNK